MSKRDIKHNAKINDNEYKIIDVEGKYIVAKPVPSTLALSGAHICFNTGSHHYDNFDGSKPVFIGQAYNSTGSVFLASGSYVLPISVKNNDIILMPKKPISELNYSQENGDLNVSVNTDGWVVALAKNEETIEEVKVTINEYLTKSSESDNLPTENPDLCLVNLLLGDLKLVIKNSSFFYL